MFQHFTIIRSLRPSKTPSRGLFAWHPPSDTLTLFFQKNLFFPKWRGWDFGQEITNHSRKRWTLEWNYLERNQIHKVKRILHVVNFLLSKRHHKSIGNKLNVDFHEISVHANQVDGKCFGGEFHFNLHRFRNNQLHRLRTRSILQLWKQQTRKVAVEPLVSTDQLIRECQPRHLGTLFKPENGREWSGEEDALDSSKSNKSFPKSGSVIWDPANGPVCLKLHTRN